jgi:two-component system, chemotaxis family, CheB/CheR fusion protein
MPNDLVHFVDAKLHSFTVVRDNHAVLPVPANSNPSVRDLMSRNGELALRNRQLTVALAQVTLDATQAMARLTPRQREVMALVLAGHPSKNIAADLHISQRTVENHRAAIMRRTGAASLPALVRLSMGVA